MILEYHPIEIQYAQSFICPMVSNNIFGQIRVVDKIEININKETAFIS